MADDSKDEWVLQPTAAASAPGQEQQPLGGKTRTKGWTWMRQILLACIVAAGLVYAAGYDSQVYTWGRGVMVGLSGGLQESEPVIEMTRQSCTLPPRLAPQKH